MGLALQDFNKILLQSVPVFIEIYQYSLLKNLISYKWVWGRLQIYWNVIIIEIKCCQFATYNMLQLVGIFKSRRYNN